jgi:proteasome activator subunit 4
LINIFFRERREKNKWYNRRQNQVVFINDKDITSFVNALKDIVFTAIFSKSNHSEAKKAFQYLTFLSADIMFPPLIEKVNLSLESLVEPHRYTSILSCLVSVARELATFNPNNLVQTQIHVIPLLCAVLPGLDTNDSHKCILTMQFISNVLNCLIVCDCSPAPNYRFDLTDIEKELCFETSKFEDFVHEFFTRIFRIIDNVASDTSSDSSASAAAASSYFAVNGRVKNTDENAYQAHMIQTIRVLIRQSSKPFLKLILNKLKNFIDGNNYNIRSGRIVASICGFLAASGYGRESFETLFNYVYENLSKFKESKSYEQFLKDERGDIEVTWNLQLLAELMKANGLILVEHINRITQLITWYRPVVNKESIGYISCCFRNIIVSLTNVSSNDLCSVTYNIIFDDEKEFFTKHLPIRDWARNGDIFDLNIKYHLPSVREIEVALDFVETFLKQCTDFISVAILENKNDEGLTSSSKEERNRELNYVNHIIYGASRLLKRTSHHKYVTEHIGSNIDIGLSDDLNKGLGFEIANMTDPNHEYSQLSARHRELILMTRENLIEFIIRLGEKLMTKHPNETTLLMLVARILATASVTYGYFTHDFEKMWKNHYANKASLQNKLLGKQNSLREELIQRILLQYQFRTFHIHTKLNTLDLRIIDILFKLSTDSLYAVVRKDAQTQLFTVMSQYPYSNLIIVPKIVEMLNRSNLLDTDSNKLTHDQLKGCLYLLRGNNIQDSLMIKQNWNVIGIIWPAFLKCQDFEKPSIQALLDKIYFKANKDYDSFDNRIELTQKCLSLVYEFSPELKLKYESNENLRRRIFIERVTIENFLIEKFMSDLVIIAREPKLLWKNQVIRYVAFLFILNSCVLEKRLLTPECVQLFVDSLVHENITVRKIAIDSLCIILKMVKFKKDLATYDTVDLIKEQSNDSISSDDLKDINKPNPGYRPDNKWHFYNPNFINTNIDSSTGEKDKLIWERAKFLDKSFWGYYCWPEKIEIVSNKRANFITHTNEYTEAIKIIRDKFQNDNTFVKKFIQFSIIEESKGNEKFDKKKFYFFKALFRNFGTTDIFYNFYENLTLLISDKKTQTQECSHKLASEMISGVIRGSKYWSLDDLKVLWSKLKPIFDLIIDNITTENLKLWYNCFSTAYVCLFFFYLN